MNVDSKLCQPAGTPIIAQTGRRLGVTLINVETDILGLIHASAERRMTLFTLVQATFDMLTLVFSSTNATRFTRVAFGHFHDLDVLNFRIVGENLHEAVERPPVQVQVAVLTLVLRLTILVFADASEGSVQISWFHAKANA
jgi:hypothetical protein